MKLVTFAGPPSSGKTAVLIKTIPFLEHDGRSVGVVKFDCLVSYDADEYAKAGLRAITGLSGNLCPDHYFVSNINDCLRWGTESGFEFLISESAGLCNRCAPHIRGVCAVCVIDCLSGVNTPKKIGPMLRMADIVVITKGDVVSQAEREVFAWKVRQANTKASIVFVNGITGQGAFELFRLIESAADVPSVEGMRLRFSIPAAVCSYCLGETRIGDDFQRGNIKKIGL